MKQRKIKFVLTITIGLFVTSMSTTALAESSWYNDMDNVTSNAEHVLSDTAISSKIKDALSSTQSLDSESLSIRTEFGHVFVSGFVKNKEQEAQILQIIKKVEGVKSVDSSVNILS